jgi:hypothetical protein
MSNINGGFPVTPPGHCPDTRRFTRSGHVPVTGLQAPTEIRTTSGFVKRPVDAVMTRQAALNLRALRIMIDRTPARRSELVLHNLELSRSAIDRAI